MTILPVSIAFAALCAIALFLLTAWVGLARGAVGVLRGDGGDALLHKRIRVHGNFVENAPIAILAVAAAEMLNAPEPWLWAAVASFVAGRVLHYLLYDSKARGLSMVLTQLPGAVLGIWILFVSA